MRTVLLSAIAVALIAGGIALYVNAGVKHSATCLLKMHGAGDV